MFNKLYFGNFYVNIKDKKDLLSIIKKNFKQPKSDCLVFYYLNSASYYHQFSDRNFYKLYKKADYCYLNSFYLGLIFKILYAQEIEKLNAEDFIYKLFSFCQNNKKKVFLLGSDKEGIKKALTIIQKNYPTLLIAGHHGYFNNKQDVINKINEFHPDWLIVGLGSGNQERWISDSKNYFKQVKVIITVGNFIDILGQKRRLLPKLFKRLQIEWLYRIYKEPGRMGKRYFFGGITVSFIFFKTLLKKLFNFTHVKIFKVKTRGGDS